MPFPACSSDHPLRQGIVAAPIWVLEYADVEVDPARFPRQIVEQLAKLVGTLTGRYGDVDGRSWRRGLAPVEAADLAATVLARVEP